MNYSITSLRRLTLLSATGLLCLGAGIAHGQRGGRQGGRSVNAASSTGGNSSASCPTGTTSTSTGSTTAATTSTSGTTTSTTASGAVAVQRSLLQNQGFSRSAAASAGQSANGFSAQVTAPNQALVRWSGATANAQTVYIGVLNANGQVIDQRAVTQLPVQANLTVTNAARYYGVRVVYANGTSSTFYSQIR